MITNDFRIAKVQRTLRWFEEDIPLLNQTRAELERLLQEQSHDMHDSSEAPCEPAD